MRLSVDRDHFAHCVSKLVGSGAFVVGHVARPHVRAEVDKVHASGAFHAGLRPEPCEGAPQAQCICRARQGRVMTRRVGTRPSSCQELADDTVAATRAAFGALMVALSTVQVCLVRIGAQKGGTALDSSSSGGRPDGPCRVQDGRLRSRSLSRW